MEFEDSINKKRRLLDISKEKSYKINSHQSVKTPQEIERELSILQDIDNKEVEEIYNCIRYGRNMIVLNY